jgi:hypothetical protein
MDDIVLRSLIQWPNVPDCFGWLALDRRGQWRMRNEYVQAHQLPGEVITHAALNNFISRNYASDELGRYFFQNGPQRVFVTLAATPWIAHITPSEAGLQLLTQCNTSISPQVALSDELGNLYIVGKIVQLHQEKVQPKSLMHQNHLSVALLLDHDLGLFTDFARIQEGACGYSGTWNWHGQELSIEPMHSLELSQHFHFVQNPNSTFGN